MKHDPLFSRDVLVRLNVHPRTAEVAASAAEMPIPLAFGVMAKDFATPAAGAEFAADLQRRGLMVSVGLGDGAADQWDRALQMAIQARPAHLNQIFPAAALSAWALRNADADAIVNALISPTGKPGYVQVATGPLSSRSAGGDLPVDVALDMLVEVGVASVKFYPLQGEHLDELAVVAAAAAQRDMIIEPTGGIHLDNLAEIVTICLDAGATRVMPHLYSSVRDPDTNDLDRALIAAAGLVVRSLSAGGC